jgi:putative ABC transport system permease protein
VAQFAYHPQPPRRAPHVEHWDFGATSLLGVRFAVERGSETNAVPVRTTILGIAAAVMGVVAALTFAASLQDFIDTPAQYGQTWDLSIETLGDAEAPLLLAADHDVASAARVRSLDATVDRHATSINTLQTLKGEFSPTVESGRMPDRPGEIALGPKLLDSLGAQVGDEVAVRADSTQPLRVVGTALNLDPQDESFGTTAYVTRPTFEALRGNEGIVNEETVLHFRAGADAQAVHRRLKIATPLGLTDESLPTRPAAVANVAEIGKVPTMLAVVLGIIGIVAAAHAVVLAVRRRRRSLAVLAALGMTQGQRLRIVLAMATTMILVGLVIGIPLGLMLGSYVWNLMATGLRVGFEGNVPLLAVGGVALLGIMLTLLVALLPARDAARVRPAPLLRAG